MRNPVSIALALWLPAFAALGQMAEPQAVNLGSGMKFYSVQEGLSKPPPAPAKGTPKTDEERVELSDLTVGIVMEWKETAPLPPSTPLVSSPVRDGMGWSLATNADSQLVFHLQDHGGEKDFIAAQPTPRSFLCVVASIRRDAKLAQATLSLNGGEAVSMNVPPCKASASLGNVLVKTPLARRTRIQVYDRALNRSEVLEWSAWAEHECTPADQRADAIALVGSTEIVRLMESGWLEARLAVMEPSTRFRTLAWEADTVFRQDRPLNYGRLPLQLLRTGSQSVLVNYGRQECLERGAEGLPSFRQTLEGLIKQLPPGALIGPVPFEARPAPQRDLSVLNTTLTAYNEAIREVAAQTKRPFIDVLAAWPKDSTQRTTDGLMLNDEGLRAFAEILIQFFAQQDQKSAADFIVPDPDLAKLRALAVQKEQLWHRYWRPSNWAFLYGDRTTQPSSRDHLNPNVRWFPQEQEQYRTLIDAKENELWKLSQDLGRKLP